MTKCAVPSVDRENKQLGTADPRCNWGLQIRDDQVCCAKSLSVDRENKQLEHALPGKDTWAVRLTPGLRAQEADPRCVRSLDRENKYVRSLDRENKCGASRPPARSTVLLKKSVVTTALLKKSVATTVVLKKCTDSHGHAFVIERHCCAESKIRTYVRTYVLAMS